MNANVLVVQHDLLLREVVLEILYTAGHRATVAADACEALHLLEAHQFGLLVTCPQPEPMNGIVLAIEAKTLRPKTPIILIGVGFVNDASLPFIEAIVQIPFTVDELQEVIRKTLQNALHQ